MLLLALVVRGGGGREASQDVKKVLSERSPPGFGVGTATRVVGRRVIWRYSIPIGLLRPCVSATRAHGAYCRYRIAVRVASLLLRRFGLDCIIVTRGYDFREQQGPALRSVCAVIQLESGAGMNECAMSGNGMARPCSAA
jgi:hypothetical protein